MQQVTGRDHGDSGSADGLSTADRAQLTHALETRFAAPAEAAAAVLRQAERDLAEARDRLAEAEGAAESQPYSSDPLVFMRASVEEEVEALTRKTNPKKIRSSYRFLLDRAVELASGEVEGFQRDQQAAAHEREHGVDACRAAVHRAAAALEAAQATRERVLAAEQSARHGLAIMIEKLTGV